jgi:hypothetical protein
MVLQETIMFASVKELLIFLDEKIYSQGFAGSYRLDPAMINKDEIQFLAQAQKLGYITVRRGTQEDTRNLFDVALTSAGLIEIVFTSRRNSSRGDRDKVRGETGILGDSNGPLALAMSA